MPLPLPRPAFAPLLSRRTRLGRLIGAMGFATLFPALPGLSTTGHAASGRWRCTVDQCDPYIYDPALGDPNWDIPPGIPFEALPEDWFCPFCGGAKEDFRPYD